MSSALELDPMDVAVVGAGVLGCAIALKLSQLGRRVCVLEAEGVEGHGLTGRNSGVVHSGLYYPPESLKARSCIRGQRLLWEWVRRWEVPHRVTGKLILARSPEEVQALDALEVNALASGAEGLRSVSPREVARLEPGIPPVLAGLFCERTGIVDPVAFTRSLRVAAERAGALVLFHAPVHEIACGSPHELVTTRGSLRAHHVVNAAGMASDTLAHALAPDLPTHHPCRGDYFRLRGRHRFQHLIYPVRLPDSPGLGIHLSLDLQGNGRLGPDAEWVDDRHDYQERGEKLGAFLEAGRRLLGDLDAEDLVWDGCGIRPKLRAPGEGAERDFLIQESAGGVLHLLGIESPGLTAAMALAEHVAHRLGCDANGGH